jgi:cytoskeletal protein CcmA (bactofilin family)
LSNRRTVKGPTSTPAAEPARTGVPSGAQPNTVSLGPRDRVVGQLYIEGDLRVAGTIQGEVEATGDVEIDDMADVKASVAGQDVSIRGHVKGPVTAKKRLLVAKSGSLTGDVRVARLVIQDGASFSGNVAMGAAAVANQPAPAAEVAETPPPEPEPVIIPDGKAKSAKRR